ncbi:fumarylacetoacetate hydrolase family protein [Crossiella sp. SN42]|uniref:2-keto-4-pentenoate hydratase n=1 Tax=Crossiella sp. SN42 TaxID=2944808 RepID=UPI00207C25F9|nr:fumarylacetoacetate hydrolase family protein [Crossiella sp. SN42]MCO1574314.1 fumarylacetoacetate hydrolase family protein [Crossiella sp. SN42]
MQPKVEAEIALILDRDLPDGDYRPSDLRQAIRCVLPALEIVDSRVAGWDIGVVDTVADNASAGLYVLGAPVPLNELDLRTVPMSLRRNGEVVSTGTGADCLGDPLLAAAWLANTLTALGDPVRSGDLLLTGALGLVVDAVPGDHFTAEFTGLGRATVHFG